jgi:predicted SnoaL-like aldol condensation-catalyzing enzyme/ketosteroid isomerase-like protein
VDVRIPAAMRRLFSTGVVLGLALGCASTPTVPSPELARSNVLDAERRWWRAVSTGDVDRALSRFSEDTIFEAPDGSQVRGRVALGARLRRDLRDRIEVLGTPEHVHIDSPELVVVTGSGRWTDAAAQDRGPTPVRYIDTWRWTGSSWRLVSSAASPQAEGSASTALVRQVLAAWSSGDWAGLQPLLAPGYRARSNKSTGDGGELRRRFHSFHRSWAKARFDIVEQFTVGERIVTRLTATLTEAGTGRTVRYAGLDVSRVVDGQLTDHWDSWEPLAGPPLSPTTPPSSGSETPAPAPASPPSSGTETTSVVPLSGSSSASSPASASVQ